MNTSRFLLGAIIISIFLTGISFAQNYKIRQTVSMNGQKSETTVYIKGARKRTEGGAFIGIGADVANIEQCDLKRNVQVNDKKKMYVIEPFDDGTETTGQSDQSKPQNPKPKTEKGGTITYISNINDTGERQQMFGMTARHIKTTMTMESSPDACMKTNMRMETDGWYVDLPEFSCPVSRPQTPRMPAMQGAEGGCRDRVVSKSTGSGKLGFALQETRTMTNGGMTFSQTTETLEFSKATLDNALFEIPNGYALAKNSGDLYETPDYSKIIQKQPNKPETQENPISDQTGNMISAVKPKGAGIIRIGVYLPTNKSSENLTLVNLQSVLVQSLTNGKIEAVKIFGEDEAKTLNCDYLLASDISKLKQSVAGKIGGIFGKVTNTNTSAVQDYEAQVDFKLISLKDGKTIQSKVTDKFKGNPDKAAEGILILESQQIINTIKN
ncbi:MAG: hypothetical protein K1X72_03775 [Pyrinomonadaceae bacterium]|nr:hypothetical protein [Pyrinomonadaceae bacterium]